jgi:large subunit ribosomal protein L3
MALGILGRKLGMTQVYDEDGNIVPVTAIEAGPCTVLLVRTMDRDGYSAVQLGFADKPRRLSIRSERGHVAQLASKRSKRLTSLGKSGAPKAGCEPQRFVRELRLESGDAEYQIGHKVTVDVFKEVAFVDVVGTSKGRGTAGVMKHFGFGGLNASHGVKRHHRAPGSVGSHGCDRGHSGKIKKGKRMSGRYGNERRTVRNLKLVRVDEANGLLLVRGAVPGHNGSYVLVRKVK